METESYSNVNLEEEEEFEKTEEKKNENNNEYYDESYLHAEDPQSRKDKFKRLQEIQQEIQEMNKKIETEKNSLELVRERYAQSYAKFCELKGKPVPQSKEDKEKLIAESQKARKNHKVSDPLIRKKLKEHEQEESQEKERKKFRKGEIDAEFLTSNINLIALENKELSSMVVELRKDKQNAVDMRKKIERKNAQIQEDIDNLREKNQKNIEKGMVQDKKLEEVLQENQKINETSLYEP